jgi:hypothetical protein
MSSFFRGASHVNAPYSHFTAVGQNQYNIQLTDFSRTTQDDRVLASLKPVRNPYVPSCMPGTREWLIDKIDDWLGDHQGLNILWLSGSPGAGKSAIASSLVSNLQKEGRLGSSFFFNRSDIASSDPAACWRTIAYDLARRDADIAEKLVENINKMKGDPEWADINLHFQYLIEEPLMEVWRSRWGPLDGLDGEEFSASGGRCSGRGSGRVIKSLPVFVLDGLDESGSDDSHYEQRQTFMKTITMWSRLPRSIKLVVTSRDEIPISFRAVSNRIVLGTGDFASPEAVNDVRVFFQQRFKEIANENYSLPLTWPDQWITEQLTSRAAGLFIWADTVVRFVAQRFPNERLNRILHDRFHHGEKRLDELYHQVMNQSLPDVIGDELLIYKLVVGAVVLAKVPLRRRDFKYFLPKDADEASITSILQNLSSVISMGAEDDFIYISHVSFAEFICDPSRCGEHFAIRRDVHDRIMALACLQIMQTELRFNICQLETSHIRNADVPNLALRIDEFIPSHLAYSCRFWSDHLQTTAVVPEVVKAVSSFMYTHLLHWLEILSLIKEVNIASQVLMSVRKWIGVSPSAGIHTSWQHGRY